MPSLVIFCIIQVNVISKTIRSGNFCIVSMNIATLILAFSCLLGKIPTVRLLGHKVNACLALQKIAQLSSKMTVPLCTINNNVEECQLLHFLANFWYLLSLRFLCYSCGHNSGNQIVVLICISLKTCDIEHIYMCLIVICISLMKWLFNPFAHFYWAAYYCINLIVRLLKKCVFWNKSFIRKELYKNYIVIYDFSFLY
jgi:hypothetical protein